MRSNINIRPMTPVHGTLEPPPGATVHFLTPSLTVLCRGFSMGRRLKTKVADKVTCPACLKRMNLSAHSKQPSCGATTGAAGLSAESAQTAREKTDNAEVTGRASAACEGPR